MLAWCGHPVYEDEEHCEINLRGATINAALSRDANGRILHCKKCYTALCIRCVWCGGIIVPDDHVRLYTKCDGRSPRADATRYGDYYIGCRAPHCGNEQYIAVGDWVADERAPGKGRVLTYHERFVM